MMVSGVMVYWGLTTVLIKHALYYMNPATYMMLRFTSAAIIIGVALGRYLYRRMTVRLLKHGLIIGLLLIIPMECMALAMHYTSAANSIFIGQLSFIFVPVFECMAYRKKPNGRLIKTIAGLLIGLAVFSNIAVTGVNTGDIISVFSAVFNSVSILVFKRFSKEDDPVSLGALQILFAAAFSMGVWSLRRGGVIWNERSVGILFFTGIIGTAVTFIVVAVGQSKTTAVSASFLHLIQPLCALLGASIIADEFGNTETITGYKAVGAVIITGTLIKYLIEEKSKGRETKYEKSNAF